MVENQIRTNRVSDPLLIEAMREVPRELFAPPQLRGIAYVDEDIPIGNGRYLMEPLIMAQLFQLAAIGPRDAVLHVGCGTGYGPAVIARMADAVVALESDGELASYAKRILQQIGAASVAVVQGPLTAGWPAQAPYDIICFGGAVQEIPPAIAGQLADGGRMVAVIASDRGPGRGTVFVKSGSVLSSRIAFDAGTPLLPGFTAQPAFRF